MAIKRHKPEEIVAKLRQVPAQIATAQAMAREWMLAFETREMN